MNISSKKSAFTLVEVLVAVAMIALIISMLYCSYLAVSRSTQAYGIRMSRAQQGRRVLDRMARQIRGSYIGSIRPLTDEATTGSQKGKPESQVDYFGSDHEDSSGNILHLVTANRIFGEDEQAGGLFDVIYRIDGTNDTLSVSQARFTGAADSPMQERNWRPLLENIEYVELAFFNGQKWLSKWDFDEEKKLPSAVKIEIGFEDEKQRQYRYGTTAPIWCRKVAEQTTQPETAMSANMK